MARYYLLWNYAKTLKNNQKEISWHFFFESIFDENLNLGVKRWSISQVRVEYSPTTFRGKGSEICDFLKI